MDTVVILISARQISEFSTFSVSSAQRRSNLASCAIGADNTQIYGYI
jgi:hypothetical protein